MSMYTIVLLFSEEGGGGLHRVNQNQRTSTTTCIGKKAPNQAADIGLAVG